MKYRTRERERSKSEREREKSKEISEFYDDDHKTNTK